MIKNEGVKIVNLSMKTVKGSLVGIALLLTLLFCVACGESDPTKESYKEAVKLYKAGNYYDAANLFDSIDYKDSQEKADECAVQHKVQCCPNPVR